MAAWLGLSFGSARGSRLVATSPVLIALGRFDEAETTLDQAMRSFSVFRTPKLVTLHQLALLRYRQQQWTDVVKLCRAVLSQRPATGSNLIRSSWLMLADALLQLRDQRGAYEAISALRAAALSLSESVQLMVLQLEYEQQLAAWESVMAATRQKLDWCELLPVPESARVHAILAMAADQTGHKALADWLAARLRLIADVDPLLVRYPALSAVMNRA